MCGDFHAKSSTFLKFTPWLLRKNCAEQKCIFIPGSLHLLLSNLNCESAFLAVGCLKSSFLLFVSNQEQRKQLLFMKSCFFSLVWTCARCLREDGEERPDRSPEKGVFGDAQSF
jgi:hypothetical protein